MTTSSRKAKAAIAAWTAKTKRTRVLGVRHIHPRAYVVARLAESCLLVAVPWIDAEPQIMESCKKFGCQWITVFDHALKAGDWCAVGYVSTDGCGESVAIRVQP